MTKNEDDIMKDLVVEIPADEIQPGNDPDGLPRTEPARREAKSVDDAVEILKRENANKDAALAAERKAREEAERRASENAERALGADVLTSATQYQLIVNGIAAQEAAAEAAQRDFVAALEAGDHVKAAEAQRRISKVETTLARLNDGKDEIEAKFNAHRQEAEVKKTETKGAETEKVSDPVDTYINGFPRLSADWLRNHRDYVTDQRLNHRMIAASHEAQAEGITLHTPEHIAFLEKKLGLAKDEDADEVEVDTSTPTRSEPARRPAVAAPVSRDSSRPSSNPSKVRLTADEVQMASDLGMTTAEYARYKVGAERAGMYNRH